MNKENKLQLIKASWPAPANIHAFTTTRLGGVSNAPYDRLNIGDHVGDDANHVLQNRQLLSEFVKLPSQPMWLDQVHGNTVIQTDTLHSIPQADASWTSKINTVCVVMTADCLPLLLCTKQGDKVAAIHGGWRSLAGNIITNTINALKATPNDILAWMGPAIGPDKFEVGAEVKEQFVELNPALDIAFIKQGDRYLANLYKIAEIQLHALGVHQIYGGEYCTYSAPDTFFSYRRDGLTGRLGTMIWYTSDH